MKAISIFLLITTLISCSNDAEESVIVEDEPKSDSDSYRDQNPNPDNYRDEILLPDTCALEKHLIKSGLVNIQKVIPGILIDLRYSTPNNFMHADVYGDLENIYLQPDVAEKLKLAQQYLKEIDSSLTLLVFDGVRPRSVQQIMWDTVDIPINERGKFIANPKNGSLHNYGAAVDLTIAKITGEELDMGTPYDDASQQSYPTMEAFYLGTGELTKEQIENRKLLRLVMSKAGFFNIQTEWWHFNSCTRDAAKGKYEIVE